MARRPCGSARRPRFLARRCRKRQRRASCTKEEGGTKTSFVPPHNDVRFRKPSPPPPNDHVGRLATARQKIMLPPQCPQRSRNYCTKATKNAACCVTIIIKMPPGLFRCGTRPIELENGSAWAESHFVARRIFQLAESMWRAFSTNPLCTIPPPAALSSRTQARTIPGDGQLT